MILFILKEKHENLYFTLSTEEEKYKICLDIVKGRYKAGYWYHAPEKPERSEELDISSETMEGLPESMRKEIAYRKLTYQNTLKKYNRKLEDWNLIAKAVQDEDAKAAWLVIQSRSGYEYEGYSIAKICSKYYSE